MTPTPALHSSSADDASLGMRLDGAPNFRDLGGHLTADGRRVRHGRVFRSGDLASLTPDDLDALSALGIQLICDLRGGNERRARPTRWPQSAAAAEQLTVSLSSREHGHGFERRTLDEYPGIEGARRMMLDTYRYLPRNGMPGLRTIAERLAAGDTPLLIHCTAGKDRTGFICASLLHALGVPRESIYADYLLTNERIDLDRMAQHVGPLIEMMLGIPASTLPREVLDVVNSVAEEYLDTMFAAVDAEFGSMDDYLDAAGIDRVLREQLQEHLLEIPARS